MSMELRTIIELLQTTAAYSICVLFAPYFVCRRYLKQKNLAQKFLICTVLGNFYLINIVFVIFLLHIPGKLSLYLFTLIPAIILWMKINRPAVAQYIKLFYTSFMRLFLGEAKIKSILNALFAKPLQKIRDGVKSIFSHLFHHLLEWIFVLGLMGFNVYYYAYQTVTKYSYGASDMIVHHQWINSMNDGVIFYNGIYPFGFHNIIYFLHNFWGISTVSLLRVFGVVEMVFIYMMIYLLLTKICRSRYVPILGLFFFTLPDLYDFQGTMRYQWALPQEFAMIFLYPCGYFLIQFFERKKEELRVEKELISQNRLYTWLELYHLRPSTRSLILFAISFSLTLAIHFYITIIAVFLCLAIAAAYFPIVLHYRYFFSIAAAGLLSLAVAVAPMGIAWLQGTPLEGSLRWALGSMSSGSSSENTALDADDLSQDGVVAYNEEEQYIIIDETLTKDSSSSGESSREESIFSAKNYKNKSIPEKISTFLGTAKDKSIAKLKKLRKSFLSFNKTIKISLNNVYNNDWFNEFAIIAVELLIAASLIMTLIRRRFYYRSQLAVGIFFFFMIMLVCSSKFSLPSVMDVARARLFTSYATPLFLAALIDFAFVLVCYPFQYSRTTELLPIGIGLCMTFLTISNDFVRPLNIVYSLQSSGEMRCNYEIIDTYPDSSWTVVTTTNSAELVKENGWHMELCTFLGQMHSLTDKTSVTIPTKYVFFYIEKYPLNYGSYDLVTNDLSNMGYVSMEEAQKEAEYEGSSVYTTENRMILESKFFYWAKSFENKYPQEFQVYYEDETFICYRIIQNEYNYYNFAIDYGYN
ncbi:MAG: hypothetical protein LUH14_05505 [Clostridiaceae bacterium]|nr:hypothetical protein [Clostridiaceae bacterium]